MNESRCSLSPCSACSGLGGNGGDEVCSRCEGSGEEITDYPNETNESKSMEFISTSNLTKNQDGTISAKVEIKLTKPQWDELHRKFGTRALACQIGLDNPQVTDFVMFQIFGQVFNKPTP
jgi:hypothetical protein